MIPTLVIELDPKAFGFDPEDENVKTALVRSINRISDRTRTKAAKMVLDQIAFPASYLNPSSGRLTVSQRANKNRLEAKLTGRSAATSLARFTNQKPLSGGKRHKGGEVKITVKPGGASRAIKRAFLIRLSNNNIGLAVRTNGGPPPRAYKPKEIAKNLWLLYGPSVDQALIAASSDRGVFDVLNEETLDELELEFQRQMDLLNA